MVVVRNRYRIAFLILAMGFMASAADAVEVGLWLDKVCFTNGGDGCYPVVIAPPHPRGSGSEIEVDAAGIVTRALLNVEGYSVRLVEDTVVLPWIGAIQPIGVINGNVVYGQSPVYAPVQSDGRAWEFRITRMTSQSDFAGEATLFLFKDDGNGYLGDYMKLVFVFDSNHDWDGDGVPDAVDNCPETANTGQQDLDSDLLGDLCDGCPRYASPNFIDWNADGIGNVCECGDQNGDGFVNAPDLIAISRAIFNSALATPLCDTNNDGKCNVQDIVGANRKIFGHPAYCSRYPPPAGQ